MKAYDIQWDVDEDEDREEILAQLPTEMEIPNDVDEEDVADYLSDQTGFCHFGFKLKKDQVFCKMDFVEDAIAYWCSGNYYNVIKRDDDYEGWRIEHEYGEGIVYDDDFDEYFEFVEDPEEM